MIGSGEAAPLKLTKAEVDTIIENAVAQANVAPSLVRTDLDGAQQTTKMHMYVIDPGGKVLGSHSMDGAWPGSIDIAKAKAWTAVTFSSNEPTPEFRSRAS